MHPNEYHKIINDEKGTDLISKKFLPILNNSKISDFNKWIQIRQELCYYQNKKRNKSMNIKTSNQSPISSLRTTPTQTVASIDYPIKSLKTDLIDSKSTIPAPEKLQFPDLPSSDDEDDFKSAKSISLNLNDNKRRVHDTSFQDLNVVKKAKSTKVKLTDKQRKLKTNLKKYKTDQKRLRDLKYITAREKLSRSVKRGIQYGKNRIDWISYK